MTAAEVIKQIEDLAPVDREVVIAFVHQLEVESGKQHKRPGWLDDETFTRAANEVFSKHAELLRKLA